MPDDMGNVTTQDINTTRRVASSLKLLDMRQGGIGATDTVEHHATRALHIMSCDCIAPLRSARAEAVAWVLNNAAFMNHDAGFNGTANRWWLLAEEIARESGNWSMVARVLSQKARQELALHTVKEPRAQMGLPMLEEAVEGDEHGMLSPTERAALYALSARCLAVINDPDADTHMGYAVQLWAQRSSGDLEARPWWTHFNDAHFLGDVASAHKAKLAHGHGGVELASIAYSTAARQQQTPENNRSFLMNLLSLGWTDIRYAHLGGDLDRGVKVATHAVSYAPRVRSARIGTHLADIQAALAPHVKHRGVGDLLDAIRQRQGVAA